MPVPNARYVSPPNPLAYCGNFYVEELGYIFVCEVGVRHLSKYLSMATRKKFETHGFPFLHSSLAPALINRSVSLSTANDLILWSNRFFFACTGKGVPSFNKLHNTFILSQLHILLKNFLHKVQLNANVLFLVLPLLRKKLSERGLL